MAKVKNNHRPKLPPGALRPAPKLLVEDGQLVIEWPDGLKPKMLVITTAGYEAMVNQINALGRQIVRDQQLVAAARKVIVATVTKQGVPSRSDADQPVDQPGGGTSMSATPSA